MKKNKGKCTFMGKISFISKSTENYYKNHLLKNEQGVTEE